MIRRCWVFLLVLLLHALQFAAQDAERSGAGASNKVFLMGNSITSEWLRLRPAFFESHLMGDDTCNLHNRGVSGETTRQMLLRFHRDVLAEQPDIIVILAGINDIAENEGPVADSTIVGNIEQMIRAAKDQGAEVLLCSILPADKFLWRKQIKPAERVIIVNQQLAALASKTSSEWVDYYALLRNEQGGLNVELAPDGVHPNAACYALMEPVLMEAIGRLIR